MVTVILNPKQEEQIVSGHSNVFGTQINSIQGSYNAGDIVDIHTSEKKFIGRGFINPVASIPVRVLTRDDEPINRDFFIRRIQQALSQRRKIIDKNTNAYRLVFSESDFLPGLIVDMYDRSAVVQTYTLGMEKNRDIIVDIIKEVVKPEAIYLRNDTPARIREGLLLEKKVIYGKFSPLREIRENGVKFIVDIENGQKTGFYIDRRDIRNSLKSLVKGKRVLDCFCYNGAFSVYAHAFGAGETVGIEISAHALKQAEQNMKLNSIDPKGFILREDNVFDALKAMSARGEKFDVVILDPPNFGSSRSKADNSINTHRQINSLAMRLLNKAGVLVSASCAHIVDESALKQIVQDAALKEGRDLRQTSWAIQSADHPYFTSIKETSYLNCFIGEIN